MKMKLTGAIELDEAAPSSREKVAKLGQIGKMPIFSSNLESQKKQIFLLNKDSS